MSCHVTEYKSTAQRILSHVIDGPAKKVAYGRLCHLCDTFGPRMLGTPGLRASINFLFDNLMEEKFNKVRKVAVDNLPGWTRGAERLQLLTPKSMDLPLLGLGSSIPTPAGGIEAGAVVVQSFVHLYSVKDSVKGKILVFNQRWKDYCHTSKYRIKGASEAAKCQAVACLVASVTPHPSYNVHAGQMTYGRETNKIPAAAITVEDARMLGRMQARGEPLTLKFQMASCPSTMLFVNFRIFLFRPVCLFSSSILIRSLGAHEFHPEEGCGQIQCAHKDYIGEIHIFFREINMVSHNILFEIPGHSKANEIVLIGAHLDSWDVGQGAMDNAGGVATIWQAMSVLKQLGLKPRRTIRCAFWTAHEQGNLGSRAYFERHQGLVGERHVFTLDVDHGVFRPTGLAFSRLGAAGTCRGGADCLAPPRSSAATLQAVIDYLEPIDANELSVAEHCGDMEDWRRVGVPTAYLANNFRSRKYFAVHHSPADNVAVFTPQDLDYSTAAVAIIAFVIADMDQYL